MVLSSLRCLVSVVLVPVLASWGSARPDKPPKPGKGDKPPTGQPGTSPPQTAVQVNAIGGILAELFQIHAGLVQLKADYGGHRVKAINDIRSAMLDLQKEMATLNKQAAAAYVIPPTGKAPPGARGAERQPTSDALMQQAAKGLLTVHQQVQKQLPGKQQAQILKQIDSAVKELQLGLSSK